MSMSTVYRFSNISSILGMNVRDSWLLCAWHSNLIYSSSNEVMYRRRCFSFDSSMMYFPVRLLIFSFWSIINPNSLLIVIALRWKYGKGSTSLRQKGNTRSWALGPSYPSWGIMANKTSIKRFRCILIMHVCNNFDMWFWFFWWGDGSIFDNMNPKCSWECFNFFFWCGTFRMCVCCE